MAIRTYEIFLDSYNSTIPEPIVGRQGDKNGAVTLHVTITDRGSAVNLTGQTINLMAETAKGTAIVADNLGVTLTDAANGKFDYAIPNALWSESGKITRAYFSLNDTDGQQTTYDLIFIVKKAIDVSQKTADDYITIVDGTLKPLQQKIDAMNADFKTRSFNVLYYGATSDKSSDSAPAINQAIEDASLVGGTVWVPAGTYLLSHDLIFKSNITFKMGNNAILYAPGQLFRFDTTSTGYSGGVSNVVVDGGTFSGDYDAKNVVNSHANANAFNGCLHHASNIEFKNVTFRMTTSNSHTLDLGGCRDINIHDCIFEGFYPQLQREYVEAIQIDYSSKSGLTYHDYIQDANIDGLVTINVKIENNTFRPIYEEDGTTIKWYAPNMCGEHTTYSNGDPTNIVIKNNHITDGYVFDDNQWSTGWIHFFGVHNIIIQGNVFESTKGQQSLAIGIMTYGNDLTDAVSGNTVLGSYSYQSDVIIKDNTFKGFKTDKVNHGLINVWGNSTYGSTNLQIINNNFIDNLPDSFNWTTDTAGIDLIQTHGFKDTKINDNYVNNSKRFLFISEDSGTTIQSSYQINNNIIKNVAYMPIVMTLYAPNQTIDINNNQFNMVRECVNVLNTNGYTKFVNNDILFHTSSHLSLTNRYSNNAVTIDSNNLNLSNNTVIQSSNSAYQYPHAFMLSADPISYSGNYFNGSSISNWKVPTAVGTNLLIGTNKTLETVTNASGNNSNLPVYNPVVTAIDSDATYTARAWISPASHDVCVQIVWQDSSGVTHYSGGNVISAGKSGYSTWAGTLTAGTTIQHVTIVFYAHQSTGSTVSYKEFKLEKGNIATDWCPNPSEIMTQSDYAKIKAAIVALGGSLK